MTAKTLTRIREFSSADVAALLSTVAGPIILLNVFGGIGSAIWLAALGEWSVLGQGLAVAFLVTFATWAGLSRCASDLNLVAALAKAGWPILAFPLWILLQLAANFVVTTSCAIILHGGAVQAQPDDFWPRLVWSFALASGYVIAAGSRGDANGPGIKVCTTFFGQLALVPTIIAVLFFKPTLNQLMIVFGSPMILSCLVQLTDFVRIFPSRSAKQA